MKKILIIDDEILVRRAIRRLFEKSNHLVFEATNGQDGLRLFIENRPDLTFLDLIMPSLSGEQFLTQLKEQGESLSSIIVISALKDIENIPLIHETKAFVPKPFENIFELNQFINHE